MAAPVRTALYVSPHLDDVALSCAGGLLRRRAEGWRVVVCTVFTEGGPRRQAQARRAEDLRALRAVGAEAVHLGFEDAPFRERVAPSFQSLVLAAPLQASLIEEVGAALAVQVRRLAPDEVWLPLGVGGHVDHRAVFAARPRGARFYEERPYAFVPALRRLRRLELEGGHLRSPPSAARVLRELSAGACGALLLPAERRTCAAELHRRLGQALPMEPRRLIAQVHRYSAQALPAAAALISAYGSQVRWLFGGKRVERLWRELAGLRGGWFEREWRFPRLRSG